MKNDCVMFFPPLALLFTSDETRRKAQQSRNQKLIPCTDSFPQPNLRVQGIKIYNEAKSQITTYHWPLGVAWIKARHQILNSNVKGTPSSNLG